MELKIEKAKLVEFKKKFYPKYEKMKEKKYLYEATEWYIVEKNNLKKEIFELKNEVKSLQEKNTSLEDWINRLRNDYKY